MSSAGCGNSQQWAAVISAAVPAGFSRSDLHQVVIFKSAGSDLLDSMCGLLSLGHFL